MASTPVGTPGAPDERTDPVCCAVGDPVVERSVRRAAQRHEVPVLVLDPTVPAGPGDGRPPVMVVVDLDAEAGEEAVAAWRARWPATVLVAVIGSPDRDRWLAAERAGCDRVVNRGAVGRVVDELLSAAGRRRWFAVVDDDDVAGRLGLVARLEQSPLGPLAVFHVAGAVVCVPDHCPHAGSALAEGILDGRVLTCPGHGSQFDVLTGERLRGPADDGLMVHRLVARHGRWYVPWDDPSP